MEWVKKSQFPWKNEVLDCYTQGMQNLSFNFAQLVYYILHLLGFMGGFFYYGFYLLLLYTLRPMKHKSFLSAWPMRNWDRQTFGDLMVNVCNYFL
jgi:hypothetical protein